MIISNNGGGDLSWEITDKPDWIEVSKRSGKVTISRDTVIVTADVNQEVGIYSGTIRIDSNGGNKDVTVTLDISIWTKMADMLMANVYFGACVMDDKIYVIGGATGDPGPAGILSSLAVYEQATDTWTIRFSMGHQSAMLSACVVNRKIYAIGGTQAFSSSIRGVGYMEMYDPMTDTWIDKASMRKRRFGLAVSAVNGKIYAIGGSYDDILMYPTVEEYDPVTDT